MRISCFFKVGKIPICYRMAIVSIIKEALRTSDEAYYHRLYQDERQLMKPFVFSTYLKNFRLSNEKIYLDGVSVTISSPDYEFLLHLYNGLQQKQIFYYKEFCFEKERVRFIKEKAVKGSTIVFRTLSPILIENEQGVPVSPKDSDYEKHVNYLADLILSQYRGIGLQQSLYVQPLRFKKTIVKESNNQFVEKYGKNQYLYFTAYHGLFELKGHPEDLYLLYQLGLSKRRNQGFGQLEIEEVKG
jgi:CRISPR-associated endoribonuclease Cas6